MGSRYTKKIPEFVYFVGEGEWVEGPYVNPKSGRGNRKFKLEEVPMLISKKNLNKHEGD